MAEKVNRDQADDKQDVKAEADTAAQKVAEASPAEAPAVAADPFPAYGDMTVDELRAFAEKRGVEINRDVEKAELVKQLREKDPTSAGLDLMALEDLRSLAADKDAELPEEFVRAHLVTELRAADTSGSGGVKVQRSNAR